MKFSKHILQIVPGGVIFSQVTDRRSSFNSFKVHICKVYHSIAVLLDKDSTKDGKMKNRKERKKGKK